MYICYTLGAGEQLKDRVTSFIRNYRDTLVSKLGFPRGWDSEPIRREGALALVHVFLAGRVFGENSVSLSLLAHGYYCEIAPLARS